MAREPDLSAVRQELDRLLMELADHERSAARGGRVVMTDPVNVGWQANRVAGGRNIRPLGDGRMAVASPTHVSAPRSIQMEKLRGFGQTFKDTVSRYPRAADTIDYLELTDQPGRTAWLGSGIEDQGYFSTPGNELPMDPLSESANRAARSGRPGQSILPFLDESLKTGQASGHKPGQLTQVMGLTPRDVGLTNATVGNSGQLLGLDMEPPGGWQELLTQENKYPYKYAIPHEMGHGRLTWGLQNPEALQSTLDYLMSNPDNEVWRRARAGGGISAVGNPWQQLNMDMLDLGQSADMLDLPGDEYAGLLKSQQGYESLLDRAAAAGFDDRLNPRIAQQSMFARMPTMQNAAEGSGKFGSIYGLTSMHENPAEQVAKEALFINNPTTDFYGIGGDDMARLADDPLGWWGTLNKGQQRNIAGQDPGFARYKNWDMDLRKAGFSTGAIDPGEILPGLQSRGAIRQGLRAKPLAMTGAGIAASEALARTLPEGYRDYARGAGYGASLAPVLGGGTVRGALKAAPALAMAGLGAAFVKDQFFD